MAAALVAASNHSSGPFMSSNASASGSRPPTTQPPKSFKRIRSSLQETLSGRSSRAKAKPDDTVTPNTIRANAGSPTNHRKGKQVDNRPTSPDGEPVDPEKSNRKERHRFLPSFDARTPFTRRRNPETQPAPSSTPTPPPKDQDRMPGGWVFQTPTLSRGSMSSPSLLASDPHSEAISIGALISQPRQPRRPQLPPQSGSMQPQRQPSTKSRPPTSPPPRAPSSSSSPRPKLPSSPSTPSLVPATQRRPSIEAASSSRPPRSPSPHRSRSPNHVSKPSLNSSFSAPSVPPATQRRRSSNPTQPHPSSNVFRSTSPTNTPSRMNASTTSLAPPSPQREAICTASDYVLKELVRQPSHVSDRDWEEVTIRIGSLQRMKRISGEDRQRRHFAEALRDGYLLCQLVNKLNPGTIPRIDHREDGFSKLTNIGNFLKAAAELGVPHDELFPKDAFQTDTAGSMAAVAQTIIAMSQISDSPPSSRYNSRSPYNMSIKVTGTMSSPNLAHPPVSLARRFSPPTGAFSTSLPASNHGKLSPTPYSGNRTPEPGPSPPPRSPLRLPNNTSARTSMASIATESTHAYSSLLENRSTRYGTIRTVNTEATSYIPSGAPSFTRSEANSALLSLQKGDSSINLNIDPITPPRRRSAGTPDRPSPMHLHPEHDSVNSTRPRRDRRSSEVGIDLSRVPEMDEHPGHERTVSTERELAQQKLEARVNGKLREQASSPDRPQLKPGKGKFPDDLMSAFNFPSTLPSSPPESPTKKPLTPISVPSHVIEGIVATNGDEPRPIQPNPNRTRRPSTRLRQRSTEVPKDTLAVNGDTPPSSRDSSTPSPPTSGLERRRSSMNRTRSGTYVPRVTAEERVPSNSRQASTPSPNNVPFPAAMTDSNATIGKDTLMPKVPPTFDLSTTPTKPSFARARRQSDFEAPRPPRGSFDDPTGGAAAKRRLRHESMVSLGVTESSTPDLKRLSSGSGLSGSAVRETLVVKEDGKPPVNYRMGNCIGRGQFGSVYRALNNATGQIVAVKRIRLDGLKEEEVTQLMKEVHLLKSLSHPGIVKYEGMARTEDTLNIVLEYVENGSLGQTLRAFGKLNEKLVASYVTKILEGLQYLHRSHVVHCDLKAANILTTKNGNVKLSDFGVSMNLLENIKSDVAGTPNWMAPEVIELKGASTASDIWSLGCTIIELLTGKPPYAEIPNNMTVMFRIVDDEGPPLPEDISAPLQDFFSLCFNKDPTKRPSAEELFEHPWLKRSWNALRDLRVKDSVPHRISVDLQKPEGRRGALFESESALDDEETDPLPLPPRTPLPEPDYTPRPHTFVKTTFHGRSVECRICHQTIKRSGVLCAGCSLIGHMTCVAEFPPNCYPPSSPYPQFPSPGDQRTSTPTRYDSPTPSTPPSHDPESGMNKLFPWRKPRPSFDGKPRPSFDGKRPSLDPNPRPSLGDARLQRPSMDGRPRPSMNGTPPRATLSPTPVPPKDEVPQRTRKTSLFGRSNHVIDRSARSRVSVASSAQSSSGRSAVTANSQLSNPPRVSEVFTPRPPMEQASQASDPPSLKRGKKKGHQGSQSQTKGDCIVQ